MSAFEINGQMVSTAGMRNVLLKGAPPLDQMINVDKGAEAVPQEWPAGWRYLLLINEILDMIEAHECEIEQWAASAIRGRVLFDSGLVIDEAEWKAKAS